MTLSIESHISDVVVFPDRARVQLVGTSAEIATGRQTLIVGDLPLVLEPDSVRVTGKGTAEVRILSVDVRRHHYVGSPASAVQTLETQLETLHDEKQVLDDEYATWAAEASYLDGLRQETEAYAKGLSRGVTTLEQQTALMAHVREQDRAVRQAQREIDKQRRDLQRQIDKTQADLDELKTARPRQRFEAQVEIEAVTAGDLTLSLSYVVRKAGWRPLYDVRLVDEAGAPRIELTTLAEVFQHTGQDWEGVALAVSTARPALNQRVPELKPWFIDEERPRPIPTPRAAKRAARMEAAAEPQPMMAATPMMAREEMAADVVSAEVVESGAAVHFAIPGESDVAGDGTPHKARLSHTERTPSIDYLAVPRHTSAVFRRAKLVASEAGPLLAGQANLFVGDAFIGKTSLPYTPARDELELLLGVEERISVERELVRRDVDKRLLRDQRQLLYGYEITLKNLMVVSAEVEVPDQIPVSRHDQIKVKLADARPTPSEKSDLNLLEWRLKLAPDAESTVTYSYQVEHPRDVVVAGLID